jgi:galactokinase
VLTRRAENEFVGVPSGIMDQFAVLLCQAGHALLLDCRDLSWTPVPLDPAAAGLELLVIDTGTRHAIGDGRYGERRQACEQAATALGARSLRDISEADLARLADPSLRRVAGHVLAERRRVLQAAGLLRAQDYAAAGALLTTSHESMRDRFGASWPQADEAVAAAVDAGAAGARMSGGGFGGCVVALTPADRAAAVRAAVAGRFAGRGWAPPGYVDATPSGAARRVR